MSRFYKFVLVLFFPILLIVVSTAVLLADPGDEPLPLRKTIAENATPPPAQPSAAPAMVDGPGIVQEGGFESPPHTAWIQSSTNFNDTIICDMSLCNSPDLAHTGTHWAWLGAKLDERSMLTQTVTIPDAALGELTFFLRYAERENEGIGNDYFRVFLDGKQLFEITDSQADFDTYGGSDYTEITININSYTDGQPHVLVFDASIGTDEGVDHFLLDDVIINTFPEAFVYLPIVMDCSLPEYTETIRYNMSIIGAPLMWTLDNYCNLSEPMTIAIIDTGVDLDHPDLQANLVSGTTFVAGTLTPDDDEGHGTHVAGIAAALLNDMGVVGVAHRARIMPVKVLDFEGSGSTSSVVAGIRWAADNGADVINLSLGGYSFTSLEQDAVNYATAKGSLVIAAAGNCGLKVGNCPEQNATSYPAAFSNVLAVASTDANDEHSWFSTQQGYVEIAAPGSSIYSTYPGGSYATVSGTSQATPHVSGLAAAIWSRNPGLTNAQVRQLLNATAKDLGSPGRDIQFGYGRINAYAAVANAGVSSLSVDPVIVSETAVVDPDVPFVPGEIIVKLATVSAKSTDPTELLGLSIASDGVTISRVDAIDAYIMTVPAGEELDYIEQLNNLDGVEYAEPNFIVTMQ